MTNIINEQFIQEEVRCGFLVSEKRKKVWLKELEMFQEFIRICNKYSIRYFAAGGTLLGAVRHSGFIPWDDDFDVFMFRDDYEKFIAVAKMEIKKPYMLQTFETDKGFVSGHAKIRNIDTTGIRYNEWQIPQSFCQGIFFDIFPLDSIPDGKVTQKLHYLCAKILKHMLNNGSLYKKNWDNQPIIKKIFHMFCCLAEKIFSANRIYLAHEKICQKYNNKKTKLLGPITVFYDNHRVHFKASDFKEFCILPFEHTTIVVPTKYDSILTTQYGDWHKYVFGSNMHGEVFFDTESPWTQYINKYAEYSGLDAKL